MAQSENLMAISQLEILTEAGNASVKYAPLLQLLIDEGQIERRDFGLGVQVPLIDESTGPAFTDSSGNNAPTANKGFYYGTTDFKTMSLIREIKSELIEVERKRSGAINPLLTLFQDATSSMYDMLATALLSDGTGNPGFDLEGLPAAITRDPSTNYLGVDTTLHPTWKNFSFDTSKALSGTVLDGTKTSEDNIIKRFLFMLGKGRTIKGNQLTHVLVGQSWYSMLESIINDKTNISANTVWDKSGKVEIGFKSLSLNNLVIMNCDGWNPRNTGGISSTSALFFNPKDFFVFYHQPFAEKDMLQKLISLDGLPERFKSTSTSKITSMFYIDTLINSNGVGFLRNTGNLDQSAWLVGRLGAYYKRRMGAGILYE